MIKWSTLGQVVQPLTKRSPVQQGWSPQCEPQPAKDGEWGVLKTTAIQAGHFLEDANKRLPDNLDPRPALEVNPGDLLVTCAGPRARCGVPTLVRHTRSRLMISGKMYRFRTTPEIDPRFLEYYLLSHHAQQAIDDMKTGISESGLNLTKDRFLRLEVPTAPMAEQLRIVEILEDHLSRLDAAGVYTRTASMRLSGLAWAARQQAISSVPNEPVVLAELIERIETGKSLGGAAPAAEDEWGIIKVSAMTWGAFRPEENKRIPEGQANPAYEIHEGDLLVSRANTSAYVGASVLVGRVRPRLLLSDKSLRLVPRAGVNAAWLNEVLLAPRTRQQLSKLATGTKDSMRNISQKSLLSISLPRASPDDQAVVVQRSMTAANAISELTSSVARAERHAKALRRALLVAAFSGRLTGSSSDDALIEDLAEAAPDAD